MIDQPLVFVDIETTGSSVTGDRVIEIGMVRIENDEIVETYETLINPESHVPEFIQRMTGIDKKDLEKAPTFPEVIDRIYDVLDGAIFVAHNARFDYGFMRNEFKRYNTTYSAKVLCTVKLSRLLFPGQQRHSLDAIINRFGLVCENRHRAYGDAKATYDFYATLRANYPHLPIDTTIEHLIKGPALPTHLPKDALDGLNDRAGVYFFYGDRHQDDIPLYIGKSTNLRDRILSHFTGDNTSTTEMIISQQVMHIETIPTAGDLGALLLESEMIKTKKPMYNRRLRAQEERMLVKQSKTPDGYLTAEIVPATTIEVSDLPFILGILPSKKAAKEFIEGACGQHKLCKKLFGLEKSSGACFYAKIDRCNGACTGIESPAFYNARFTLAFAKTKIAPWPYKGPTLVFEHDKDHDKTEIFLIDNWCYLAKLTEDEIPGISEISFDYTFEYDVYKILKRYIDKKVHKIILLSKYLPT